MITRSGIKISAILMLLAFSFTAIPFSAFHHHESVCDVASALPLKFRKEKDQAKHHFHKAENKCFVCSNALIKHFTSGHHVHHTVLSYFQVTYFAGNYLYTFSSLIELNNKAPPVTASKI